ncbi:MAG: hypothetical protein ACREWG_00655 [Gammaproteobacteria bacterium]
MASEEAFNYLFAVNIKAAFFLIQRLKPVLRDGGRIANISSAPSITAFRQDGLRHGQSGHQRYDQILRQGARAAGLLHAILAHR